jgi:broad specificity phosphatase PhoE
MMRLILVRHCQTDRNQQRLLQGHSPIELNAAGRKEAQALALALRDEKIEAIYSSPLSRSLETAQAINRFHHLAIESEDGLKELDIGDLDGLTIEEMKSRYSSFWRKWRSGDPGSAKCPNGESLDEAQQRAWGTIQEIKRRHCHQAAIVVTHYFVIVSVICKALGIDLSHMRRLRALNTGAISILDFRDEGATLTLFNDTCHMPRET